ncbi:MAG: hypothetical protein CVT66_00915 [Actinobacteria bacterium HGW-Actinobacteria-6]|jgi:hypothetical protein|nr:MAG: hypothetical protein CVT66_00915 [Actinobacteria bacterium HGW-Actinobacteria-6]
MAAIPWALSAHETKRIIIHVVLLLPVEFGNSYSWRWKTSTIIQTQNARLAITNTPMHPYTPQSAAPKAASPLP